MPKKFTDTRVYTLELEDEVIEVIKDCANKYLQNLTSPIDLFDGVDPKSVVLDMLQDILTDFGHVLNTSDIKLEDNKVCLNFSLSLGYDSYDNPIEEYWDIKYYPSVDQFKGVLVQD